MRERWYLYGDQADQALSLLRSDLEAAHDPLERAALLRWLPNLGAFAEAEGWLQQRQPQLLHQLHGRATLLRLRQHHGHPDPWQALLPPEQAAAFEALGEGLLAGNAPFEVWLHGGLGDQLEAIALMRASTAASPLLGRLRLVLPVVSAGPLAPLLAAFDAATIRIPWRVAGVNERPQGEWLSMYSFRSLLVRAGLERSAEPIAAIPAEPPAGQMLCCWRSKVDPQEKLWSFLRSLPFGEIVGLYRQLLPQLAAEQVQLLDLTAYSPWERQALAALPDSAGVLRFHDPTSGSLVQTADQIRASAAVISVDTALVHLARWFDWPTLLLLHQHPDERWRPWLQGGAADGQLRLIRQTHYNHWRPCLEQLLDLLPDWRVTCG